uniref:Peptidase S1 domain-containing protein n=1 Tax=Panagrolaimus sp. JU765 TaxID=591449 RepID=A0AC34PYQ9_9BILA
MDLSKQEFYQVKERHYIHNEFADIALVELETPIKFSDKISPICLAKNDNLTDGELMIAAGWGWIFNYIIPELAIVENLYRDGRVVRSSPTILNERIIVNKIDQECLDYISQYTTPDFNLWVCNHGVNSGVENGDSGGPAMALKKGKWTQVGIVSGGIPENRIKNRIDLKEH